LPEGAYAEMLASTTLLNRVGHELAQDGDVHAITDVTGFGLLGHALELARGSGLRVRIEQDHVPFLDQAEALAQAGFITGASNRNWNSYGDGVVLPTGLPDWRRALLTDPQTSGGLLVACKAERAEAILATIEAAGYPRARIVGTAMAGAPGVEVV
jgi:selenide,water dikinase